MINNINFSVKTQIINDTACESRTTHPSRYAHIHILDVYNNAKIYFKMALANN